MLGYSTAVDSSVIAFPFSSSSSSSCVVSFFRPARYPRHGSLVISSSSSSSSSSSPSSHSPSVAAPATVLNRVSCASLPSLGLVYAHANPPSPDRDFIPLLIQVLHPSSASLSSPSTAAAAAAATAAAATVSSVWEERVWLPVRIGGGATRDLRPEVALDAELLLEVDEFVLTTLPPGVLAAVDAETPAEELIFVVEEAYGGGGSGSGSGTGGGGGRVDGDAPFEKSKLNFLFYIHCNNN